MERKNKTFDIRKRTRHEKTTEDNTRVLREWGYAKTSGLVYRIYQRVESDKT